MAAGSKDTSKNIQVSQIESARTQPRRSRIFNCQTKRQAAFSLSSLLSLLSQPGRSLSCLAGCLSVGAVNRRQLRALICLFLMICVQVVFVASSLAQTKEPGPGQSSGNNGSQVSGDAAKTQNTVPNPYIDAPGFIPVVNTSSDVNVKGGGYNGGSTKGIQKNVNDILRRDNPYGQAEDMPTTLVFQSAEQLKNNPQQDVNNILNSSLGSVNDTYRGLHQWFNDDVVGNLFSQIGQLIGKWISELINGWIADTVQFLAAFLRVFVLNPNIAVNGLNGSQNDGISPYIRQGADVMYGIAVDLLLLLFILAIWKYWAEASWRGGGNLMGAVGRLIFTAGLMLAFPTLYAFEIQITNEMIKAIYFNSSDQVLMLDSALASAVRGGILAGVGGLASAFAPLLGGLGLGIIGGTVGEVFAFAGLVIFLILGGILITELIYILVLKAIQTALLTAQYMFAPIFLVFFATPDTENVATGFVKAFVETSLWTFVWVGLLKIMVIVMFSDYNPWGKILIAVGVLQMMIQVPSFLARAQISPMSDFITAGLITGGLLKMFGWMGKTAQSRVGQAVDYFNNQKYGARGLAQTSNTHLNGLNTQSSNPGLESSLKDATKTGKDVAGSPPKKPTGPVGPDGKPIVGPHAKKPGDGKDPLDPTKTAAAAGAEGKKVATPGAGDPAASAGTTPGGTDPSAAGHRSASGKTPTSGLGKVATAAGVAAAVGTAAAVAGSRSGDPTASGHEKAGSEKPLEAMPPTPPLGKDPSQLKNGETVKNPDGSQTKRVDGLLGGYNMTTLPDGTKIYDFDNGKRAVKGPDGKWTTAAAGAAGGRVLGSGRKAAAASGAPGDPASAAGVVTEGADGSGGPPTAPIDPAAAAAAAADRYKEPALTAQRFDQEGLYMVAGVRGPVKDIRDLKLQFRGNQADNSIRGSSRGGASQVNVRKGATPTEVAHALMTVGFANEMTNDPAGADAARQSAIDAGADQPHGLWENMSANWLAYTGSSFKQTATAKQRFGQSLYAQAAKGSSDYIGGHSGNAYTQYLRQRYGDWDKDKDATCVFLATDTESSESAWNSQINAATDALISSGIPISAETRGAMQNQLIMQQRPGARKAAVRALLRATYGMAKQAQADHNISPDAFNNLHGEIARNMPEDFTRSAIAIDAVSGGADVSPASIDTVQQLSSELGLDPGVTYRAMQRVMPGVASSIASRDGRFIARADGSRAPVGVDAANFDQVSALAGQAYADAGPGAAQAVYGQVLTGSANAVRMMTAAGITPRQMTEPGFAQKLDSYVAHSAESWDALVDVDNPGRQDALQAVASAAGATVRHLGTGGFTPGRAGAALQYVQSGGSINNLSAGKIVVAERIVDAGYTPTDSMVESLIRLDPIGQRNVPMETVQTIASHIDAGNARPENVAVVSRLMDAGVDVNRQTVEVGIRQMTAGSFNPGVVRMEATMLQAGVATNAAGAHSIMQNCVIQSASRAGINTANVPMNQIIQQLESQGVTISDIGDTIMDIQRKGGFQERQLASPTIFQVAYDTQMDHSASSHRLQSIRVAEQIHGIDAVQDDPTILNAYDEQAEYGVKPQQMSIQTCQATRALAAARQAYHSSPGADPSARPVMPTARNLQRIIEDKRFVMGNPRTAPSIDPNFYSEMALPRPSAGPGGGGGGRRP